jgi:outer membrane protein OmpA-like peptidoglycan-associated protein
MGKKGSSLKVAVAALVAVVLAGGCSHLVHVEEVDARFAALNSSLDDHAAQLAALAGLGAAVADLEGRVSALEDDLAALRRAFEECGCGGMALGLPVYFDFNSDVVRDIDKPVLDEFARVMGAEHGDALVTLEGFADEAGSVAYNLGLGRRRAANVKAYLASAGMNDARVRTVSYGEVANRQVNPGVTGARDPQSGIENRRVTFVLEWDGRVGSLGQ